MFHNFLQFILEHFNAAIYWLLVVTAPVAFVLAVIQLCRGPRALSLLVFRYLRKRRIAWVSLIAVILCTMMVLVVISVMGGWLKMFRETAHGLYGDIIISRNSLDGFTHYQEMIDRISALPDVKAATPEVHTFALINVRNQVRTGVNVIGLDLNEIKNVNGFAKSLWLQPDKLKSFAKAEEESAAQSEAALKKMGENDDPDARAFVQSEVDLHRANAAQLLKKAADFPSFDKPMSAENYIQGMPQARIDVSKWPGIIVGTGVIGVTRDENGNLKREEDIELRRAWVRLTLLRINSDVSISAENAPVRSYWIVDDSHTDDFPSDEHNVYVPFDILQRDLNMDAQDVAGADGSKAHFDARCNSVLVSLKDPALLYIVKPKIAAIVDDVEKKYALVRDYDPVTTQTWEEKQAEFLSAVENEKGLLVILFAIISVVAVFLIFCIFFMIVMEKTKDIGIIKSVGATSTDVASIFLSYGMAIGIVGGGMGLLLGYLIVHYINQLHNGLHDLTGRRIWDPRTYLFDKIPNTMDPHDVTVIVCVAVLASVVGALVPAIRAARMNPVEALRSE